MTLECELGTAPEHETGWLLIIPHGNAHLTPVDTIKKDGCVIVGNAIASKTGRS